MTTRDRLLLAVVTYLTARISPAVRDAHRRTIEAHIAAEMAAQPGPYLVTRIPTEPHLRSVPKDGA